MADEPQGLSHIEWKIANGFGSVGTDHVQDLVKWARSLAAENEELRALVARLGKKAKG